MSDTDHGAISVVCAECGGARTITEGQKPESCPHCGRMALVWLPDQPAGVDRDTLARVIRRAEFEPGPDLRWYKSADAVIAHLNAHTALAAAQAREAALRARLWAMVTLSDELKRAGQGGGILFTADVRRALEDTDQQPGDAT